MPWLCRLWSLSGVSSLARTGLLEQAVVVSTASDEMLCPQEEPSDSHTGHGTELPSQASLPHPTNSTPISPPHGPSGDIDDKPDKVAAGEQCERTLSQQLQSQ